jgi:hypothetical protein
MLGIFATARSSHWGNLVRFPPLPILALLLVAGGCTRSHAAVEELWCPEPNVHLRSRFGPPWEPRVDLLLVVDRSPRMEAWQPALAADLRRILDMLARGNPPWGHPDHDPSLRAFSPPLLRLGVVFADTAREVPPSGPCSVRPHLHPYWQLDPGDDPTEAIDAVVRLATAGTVRCPITQPLEAALTWLEARPDFTSDDAFLAVVVLTAGDDCSLANAGLADPDDPRFEGDLQTRCWLDGNAHALRPVEESIDELFGLRPRPWVSHMGLAVGVPPDLARGLGETSHAHYERVLADPRLTPAVDELGAIVPSCEAEVMGTAPGEVHLAEALPPPRLVRAALALEQRGPGTGLASVCALGDEAAARSLSGAFDGIFEYVAPVWADAHCSRYPWSPDADERIPCRFLFLQPEGTLTCDARRGRLPLPPPHDLDEDTGRLVCEVAQVAPSDVATPGMPGWSYIEGPDCLEEERIIVFTEGGEPIDGERPLLLECCVEEAAGT